MASFTDPELGEIIVRRSARATQIRIKIGTDGRYVATAPAYTPVYFIKQTVRNARDELKQLAKHSNAPAPYVDKQQIGKSHALAVVATGMVKKPQVKTSRQRIVVMLPNGHALDSPPIQQQIRDEVAKILRREAKAYLPRRLATLASTHGFRYERVRFSHSGGRWGSCSSTGTISLNIALMKLPHELIDYVLIHELCHTRHMNHSKDFWDEVARYDPLYKSHVKRIKHETPAV